MEKLGNHVPETINFNVGYFEGKQSKKRWLCCQEDLESMYRTHKNGDEITLWCEAKTNKRKKDDDDVPCTSKTQSKEAEVDSIFSELKKKHHEIYEVPKLRLWACMIVGGLHSNTDKPPDIPVFHCGEPQKRKESIAGAITGAVDAFVKLVEQKSPQKNPRGESPAKVGTSVAAVSSAKVVDLRMKNFEQLCYLQGLFEDGILSQEELNEQKKCDFKCTKKVDIIVLHALH